MTGRRRRMAACSSATSSRRQRRGRAVRVDAGPPQHLVDEHVAQPGDRRWSSSTAFTGARRPCSAAASSAARQRQGVRARGPSSIGLQPDPPEPPGVVEAQTGCRRRGPRPSGPTRASSPCDQYARRSRVDGRRRRAATARSSRSGARASARRCSTTSTLPRRSNPSIVAPDDRLVDARRRRRARRCARRPRTDDRRAPRPPAA